MRVMKEIVKLKQLLYCLPKNFKLKLVYYTDKRKIERVLSSGTPKELDGRWREYVVKAVYPAPANSYYDRVIVITNPYSNLPLDKHGRSQRQWRMFKRGKEMWY